MKQRRKPVVNPLSSSRMHSARSPTSETLEQGDYILLPDMPSPEPRTHDAVMKSPDSRGPVPEEP